MANPTKARRLVALVLALLLSYLPASAGVVVYRGTQGLVLTGTDGVYYDNTSGLVLTGTDGLLGLSVNGIGFTATGNGLVLTGTDGQTVGADGATYTGANSYTATRVDGLVLTGTDGLVLTGTDGLVLTGTDGTVYQANSFVLRRANGLVLTGTDGVSMVGVQNLAQPTPDSLTFPYADGITGGVAESVRVDGAAQVTGVRADGTTFPAPTSGLAFTQVDGLVLTGTDNVSMYGVNGLVLTGSDGLPMQAAGAADQAAIGLVGIDPELALLVNKLKAQELLNQATDDSNINAVLIYHQPVTEDDLNTLRSMNIRGGTRFRALPMVVVSGTADQIIAASKLPAVRYLAKNRTLQWDAADESRAQTGLSRVWSDAELRRANNNLPVNGSGVAVAVIDTGLDSTHADLAGRVAKNVRLADLQGASPFGFSYPSNVETLQSTDLAGGHGTFVSGIIAGSGANSAGGKYAGYAPGARIVGLSAGDVTLFHVLAGFDYLLSNPQLGVRVVNCSFSANTLYHEDDPVNVATRMLTERGVNVVVSAGNSGPGMDTLNPYAAAPWVISVGAVDQKGRLAGFSSRGVFGARNFRPTLVAGGVDVVSLRAAGTNLTGTNGLAGGSDAVTLSPTELPYYTTASGTSFSAPQVAGTVALMLQANPRLSPAEVRDILQRTATPLPSYFAHEAGAGLLNTHAAVREAMFPQRRGGLYRSVLDREQVEFALEPAQELAGTLTPGSHYDFNVQVPADAVLASASVAWGPMTSVNDLGIQVFDPSNAKRAESNFLNLPGLTGKREGTTVRTPEPGTWRVRVHFTAGLAATPQSFKGVFQVVRARYGELNDLAGLDPVTLDSVRRAARTFSMWPDAAGNFRPSHTLKRGELAAAMLTGARVPQFMPTLPSFTDVADATTMSFAESAQSRPGGALFPDAPRGGSFRPDEGVSRLLAAIVLVRAAGLEAETKLPTAGTLPGVTDAALIPYTWRGHVSVALAHGLVSSGPQFNPDGAFTRGDLARALAVITHLQTKADDEE